MSRKLPRLLALLLFAIAANGQVMINEFFYDNISTDNPAILFTEIYGPAGTNLSGWSLTGTNGNQGGEVYLTVPLTGQIPADGYYVVGGASVTNVDQIVSADWQNAGSSSGDDCDGIELRNSGGQVVDHVCYGNCAAGNVCNGEGGSNAPDPFGSAGVERCIARIPDHQDTDSNGNDFASSDALTPGAPNSGEPCDPQTVGLIDVRANDGNGVPVLSGQFVVVTGLLNVNNYTLDSLTLSNFFIQDEDAGVNVFRGNTPQGVVEGTEIRVSGWVGSFNGLTEILSSGSGNCTFEVEIISQGSVITPQVLQCSSPMEFYEGMLARINGVTITDGNWPSGGQNANLTITDGTGTLTLRIDKDTQIDGSPAPQGAFDVIGIITQFDSDAPYTSGYQITPRYVSDINSLAAEPEHDAVAGDFSLAAVYPNPFNNSARIAFEVGTARDLSVSIVDLQGREVYSRTLENLTPGTHEFSWNPAGSTGLYFLTIKSASTTQSAKLLYLK